MIRSLPIANPLRYLAAWRGARHGPDARAGVYYTLADRRRAVQ